MSLRADQFWKQLGTIVEKVRGMCELQVVREKPLSAKHVKWVHKGL